MGYLREKYTKEYFTGRSKGGKDLQYGVEKLIDAEGNYTLRDHDRRILGKVNFKGKNVLALGCGRGEELAYAIEQGADVESTIGVDFSAEAIKICKETFVARKINSPKLVVADALHFVAGYVKEVKKNKSKKFDIVIMFDFVEHVPRNELSIILNDLKNIITPKSLIAINTPAYKYDNDVIANGFDDRIQENIVDLTDKVPETQGMHCNKYSRVSLQEYMLRTGYANITEAHYFLPVEMLPNDFLNVSYLKRWNSASASDVPIKYGYQDDQIEYPYSDAPEVKLLSIKRGIFSGISILGTEKYGRVALEDGLTDLEMMLAAPEVKRKGITIFDIDAKDGASAIFFSSLVGEDGRVVGFVPNPSYRNRAFLNLSHNPKYGNNVLIYGYALGDDNKRETKFVISNIDAFPSHPAEISLPESSDLLGQTEIETKTLDSFLKGNKLQPHIVRIDAEGSEYSILLGAINMMKNIQPMFFIKLYSQYSALKCSELLASLGYSTEILKEEADKTVIVKYFYAGKNKKPIKTKNIAYEKSLNSAHLKITELGKHSKKLSHENLDLKRKYSTLTDEHADIVGEHLELRKQRDTALENLNELLSSKSWRMTEPLRIAFRLFGNSHNNKLRKNHE